MMFRKTAVWISSVLAVASMAVAVVIASNNPVAVAQVQEYSLPGLYSAAFPGAGIRADSIVFEEGENTWRIPTAAVAPTPAPHSYLKTTADADVAEWIQVLPTSAVAANPAVSRYLRVTADDPTVAEWVELNEGGGLPPYQQSEEEFLSSRAGNLDWQEIREVPIAGTIGHVLTKHGDNDDDYRFQDPTRLLNLAFNGGLHLTTDGRLATTPALTAVAEEADEAHNLSLIHI